MPEAHQPMQQPAQATLVDQINNPIAVTPTTPPTQAPIVGQGPVTESAPLNVAMGAAVVGASQYGMAAMTQSTDVLAVSVFLNLLGQLVKGFKWFDEHKLLILVFLVASFLVCYFVLYGQDHNLVASFKTMANSTMQAVLNYKGDKAAGLNVMPPTPAEREFGA